MKVLKEGNWKMPWEGNVVCSERQCSAELLVAEKDLHAVDYSSNNDFYVVCPVCGQHIRLIEKDIPLRIQRELNNKRKYSTGGGRD